MVGESGSKPSDRPDRPEPQMIPMTGMGMDRERSSDRMYDAARRYGTWDGSRSDGVGVVGVIVVVVGGGGGGGGGEIIFFSKFW
jgi:hypothetical protein